MKIKNFIIVENNIHLVGFSLVKGFNLVKVNNDMVIKNSHEMKITLLKGETKNSMRVKKELKKVVYKVN